jgi:RIO kinase 1
LHAARLAAYFGRFAPELLTTDYGMEIWSLYQSGKLHPEIELTGRFARSEKPADVGKCHAGSRRRA